MTTKNSMNKVDIYLDYVQEVVPMLAFSIAGLLMGSYNIYKQYLTKAAIVCKDLPPREKGICMIRWKLLGKKKQLSKLQKGRDNCKKSKNPEECTKKLLSKIEDIKKDIQFFTNRLDELRKQQY